MAKLPSIDDGHCGNPECALCNRLFGEIPEQYEEHVIAWCDSWNGMPHETEQLRAWLEMKATHPRIH